MSFKPDAGTRNQFRVNPMIGATDSASDRGRILRGAFVVFGACFFQVALGADTAILKNGIAVEGNVVLIGDKKQWDTFVGSDPVATASGYLSVDPDEETGAIRASWTGDGEAQFFVAHESPRDYSPHMDQDAALALIIRVDAKPKKKVRIRLGCGYPCASDADITRLLDALPTDQWVRASFDLKCFADGGLDVKKVDTPLLITTRGQMSLSISDVSIVPGLGPEATINCR